MRPEQSASLYAPSEDRVSNGTSFLAPGSLARRRLARLIHHKFFFFLTKMGLSAPAKPPAMEGQGPHKETPWDIRASRKNHLLQTSFLNFFATENR